MTKSEPYYPGTVFPCETYSYGWTFSYMHKTKRFVDEDENRRCWPTSVKAKIEMRKHVEKLNNTTAPDMYEAAVALREAQKAYLDHKNVGLAYERPKEWYVELEKLSMDVDRCIAMLDAAIAKAEGNQDD